MVNDWKSWQPKGYAKAHQVYVAHLTKKGKGYTILDYLCCMLECVIESKLKDSTKNRLMDELDELEMYHYLQGTLEHVL